MLLQCTRHYSLHTFPLRVVMSRKIIGDFLKPQGAVGGVSRHCGEDGVLSWAQPGLWVFPVSWGSSGHSGAAPPQSVLCPLPGKLPPWQNAVFTCARTKDTGRSCCQLSQRVLKPNEGTVWPLSLLIASFPVHRACPLNASMQTSVSSPTLHDQIAIFFFFYKPACQPFEIYHLLKCFASIR